MTLKFLSQSGKIITSQIDFGPNTLVVVPQVGDTIEIPGSAQMMKVVERRYCYVDPNTTGMADPHPVIKLILDSI